MSTKSEQSPPEFTLQSLLEAIEKAPDITSIKNTLSKHILDVFQVEMATIFLANSRKKELSSWLLIPGESLKQIIVPFGTSSIVGYVAMKKQPINLRDPYDVRELSRVGSELNFFATYDEQANVRSKQILALPIIHNNILMGVIELINKKDDTDFSHEDQGKVNELAGTLAIAFSTHSALGKLIPPKYEALLEQKLLTRKQLEKGLTYANEQGENPEVVLMQKLKVPKQQMGELLAEYYSTTFVDLEKLDNNPKDLFKGMNIDYFEEEELVPLSLTAGKLTVAAWNIDDQTLSSTIREHAPRVSSVDLVFAFQADIDSYWKRIREKSESKSKASRKEKSLSSDSSLFDLLEDDILLAPAREQRVTVVERQVIADKSSEQNIDINEPSVVKVVNQIIEGGCSSNASDIHIEPQGQEENGKVRFRINGVCYNAAKIPQRFMVQVTERFKHLAGLKRDERTRPQVGRFECTTSKGKNIELRVTTIPTVDRGEDIVLHIVADPMPLPSLEEIMPERFLQPFQEMIRQKQGLILVVGPNASGKTTTLHSALADLNHAEKKIWTAEYPVEIRQEGIRQVQVDPLMNYSFAAALRAFLRADPDIIMVGEIQDLQTAMIAVDAALDNHLLLSCLVVNSAAEGITHCLNMGLDPLQLASVLKGVLAQTLVRTLCEHCKEAYHPEQTEYDRLLESYGVSFFDHINVMYSGDLVFYRGKGCPQCNETGYQGKKALYELLVVNTAIRKLIMKQAPLGKIIEEAILNDMTLLMQEGIRLVFEGEIESNELKSISSL